MELDVGHCLPLESVNRFRWAMSDFDQYTETNATQVKKRLENLRRDKERAVVLFTVYTGKGLPWAVDQFSRQKFSDGMQVVVFQNGFEAGDQNQLKVQKMCDSFGIDYRFDPTAYGPWGGKAHIIRNFEQIFPYSSQPFLLTFDEDTAPVQNNFLERRIHTMDRNNLLGALYSPTIFLSEGSNMLQTKMLAYKSITMMAQAAKVASGGIHPVGSDTVFRIEAIIKTFEDNVWKGDPDKVNETEMAWALIRHGWSVATTFDPRDWVYTSGDKLSKYGVGKYLSNVGLSSLPDGVKFFERARRIGSEGYADMYKKNSEPVF